jgi:2,3-dihydro-2,3-dihydroxybenzoate dehydrogenase
MQMAAYCASKAAVTSLTQTVGLELATFGVRVNLVSPGSTDTEMLRGMLPDEGAMARTIKGLPDQFKLGIPLNKIATPREIANTVLFLASDLASHITMQDLVVDGGATLSA